MTIKKITNFIFPVGKKKFSQDAYYKALSETNSGFYPFGENGIWHGGIHLDEAVLNKIGSDGKLRCMANGEVVAYRINNVYPKIVYNDNDEQKTPTKQQKVAYFSSGFTLVRHYLEMPKIADSSEPPPAITLYSLYMHQLDWYGYEQKKQDKSNQVEYPHFWQVKSAKVNEEKAEAIQGCEIRKKGKGTKVVGLLLKGSKIRLGEQRRGRPGWYKIVSITQGTLVTSSEIKNELGDIEGYVWHENIGTTAYDRPTGKIAEANKDYVICREDNNKVGHPEKEIKGIAIYESATGKQKLTYLPQSATFEFDGQENGYAKIRKISQCTVPTILINKSGDNNSPHKGYVKLTSLLLTSQKPEKLDEVVVLKEPIPIEKGAFVGYIGHNVSQSERFDEPKEAPLSTMKRALDNKLPELAHIELFTCENFPAFINKTRALADKLPNSEKTIILVEKDANLISASKPDGFISKGPVIKFIGNTDNYYVKITLQYTLQMLMAYFDRFRVLDNKDNTTNTKKQHSKVKKYRLTKDDKTNLVSFYEYRHPELNAADIPDEVELLIDYTPLILSNEDTPKFFEIRFCIENKHYWIASKDVLHLGGKEGQLNSKIECWKKFPLSLENSKVNKNNNTVYYPRTISINASSDEERLTAVDDADADTVWRYIQVGNKYGLPIQGWVNTKKGAQPHIKLVTPWHWSDFKTLEEKASVGDFSKKLNKNRAVKLNTEDYSETMMALIMILSQTGYNHSFINTSMDMPKSKLKKFLQQLKINNKQPFINDQFKDVLRTSWTAEQIGHLSVKYESEWYADEALKKWNEIDSLFDEEKQQNKKFITNELDNLGITKKHERKFALDKVEEAHEYVKKNWQIEKTERIKPSLWWKNVSQAQSTDSTNNNKTDTNTDTPKLANLSTDGKAWFIHPVAMVNYFNTTSPEPEIIFPLKEKPINNSDMQLGQNFNWTENNNQTAFGWKCDGGKRKHAGRDLYTEPNAEIVAICDGTVLGIDSFYSRTYEITIKHKTKNGRQFIIRYGEVDYNSITVKVGDSVKQGTVIAKTGLLLKELKRSEKSPHSIEIKTDSKETTKYKPELIIDDKIIYILHLEYYSGENGLDLNNPLTDSKNQPYQRRADLLDPLDILKEGYENTFSSDF